MILRLWCTVIVLFLYPGILPAASESEVPSCIAPPLDDPAPWIWRARILASFPPDAPRPKFLGGFRDKNSQYELHLWRDTPGIFGQLLSPVLEADSPASRLYDAHFDGKTGAIGFMVRFDDGERRFMGRLDYNNVTITTEHAARGEKIVLQKLQADRVHGVTAESYTSRAQFQCAMVLFGRY